MRLLAYRMRSMEGCCLLPNLKGWRGAALESRRERRREAEASRHGLESRELPHHSRRLHVETLWPITPQREHLYFGALAALPPISPADLKRLVLGRPGVRSGSFAMWLGLTASESMSTSMTPEWRSTFTYASMKKPGWMHLLYQAGRLLRDVRPFFFASAIR
jgi:hypothetical protein